MQFRVVSRRTFVQAWYQYDSSPAPRHSVLILTKGSSYVIANYYLHRVCGYGNAGVLTLVDSTSRALSCGFGACEHRRRRPTERSRASGVSATRDSGECFEFERGCELRSTRLELPRETLSQCSQCKRRACGLISAAKAFPINATMPRRESESWSHHGQGKRTSPTQRF
jgi:hypothetical protein